jgi:ubiquinol-cytochrome c reductase core subunit 2
LFAEILSDVVSKQKYQEHEFVDVVHQTAAEAINAYNCAETRAIETAHQVAFRNGLGNSIFAKPTAHVNNATVKAFAQHIFTQSNVALVGTGIDHEILSNLADTYLNLPQGQVDLAATKYYGGESRIDDEKAGEYVIAFEGAAAGSVDYNALQVLRYALGGESVVQNASPVGVLAQTAAKFSEGTAIKAFNLGYSDAGLFGVQVSAASAETGAAAAAAAEQLKAVASGLDSAVFEQALAQAKYAAATSAFDTRLDRVQTLGAQAFGAVAASTAQVTSADVANVSC